MKFKLVNVLKFTQKRSTNHLRQFCLFGLLLLCTQLIYADERGGKLFGKVISTEKENIEFATVHLKGTTHGTVTNEEGIYELKAPAGKYTLVVSILGYNTVEKEIYLKAGERQKEKIGRAHV